MDLEVELNSTNPDYVVYVPKHLGEPKGDSGNEHFLVFDGPDGSLMAVWTQSTFEGMADPRIVFSRSDNEGESWSEPVVIAAEDPETGNGMASWAFPMVSHSGRIYVLYSRHIGVNDYGTTITGLMGGIYSDDNGETWSREQRVPMRRSVWDNPDPDIPANWIVWQKPLRLSEGKYYAGFTRWVSTAVKAENPYGRWTGDASVTEFMRFENIDDDPEVGDIELQFFMKDHDALQVSLPDHPEVSVVHEPTIVPLPDGRLFCVVRTMTGCPYWTVSDDAGFTWQAPEPLRQFDGGPIFQHPLSPCPMYCVDEGEYFFLFHNHDGHFEEWTPQDTSWHRRPIYVAHGQFRPDAHQPVWFADPVFLMDNTGNKIGYGRGRTDLAMYDSVTIRNGMPVLWYPERKFFLLGKKMPMDWLAEMVVRKVGSV
ncbi:MAG: hypothetical protein HN521_07605 [Candidatus Latescibacteria bacterium]|nr:hypothetical protein [Candidatus Latescibacterota bacterium]